ncbi:tyrosine-type recombinase/integrase [Nocardioides caldifontis]|uniref:tyrosine-type recombinase/integrase n=1 Tax=Nocardioides caldifontis TaxID=2588938 RepID=UPI0011DFCE9E|nr:tyrosine-type recombinase/integrase [Nocardioides caldifontis]
MSRKNANGEGSVYKRADGRWVARFFVTEADGQRVRHSIYAKSRAEAEAALREVQSQVHRGAPVTPARLTLAAYLEEWLDQVVVHRVRPNTLAAYRYNAERYLIPDLGGAKLAKLTARDVRLYLDRLRGGGVGTRTIQYVHQTLRAALEDGVREELLEKNVAKLVRAPRVQQAERVPLTVEDVRALLKSTREHRLHAMFVVLAVLGLRRSELLGLHWDDVDFTSEVLQIRRGLHRLSSGLETMPTKTLRSRRTVPLPSLVTEALIDHRARQDAERRELGDTWPDLGFVFTTPVGTPIDPRNCTRIVQDACTAAGVRRVRMHDFRHGAVSVLLRLGVPPRTVMEIAGHSALEMTMNVYGHVTLDDKREALDRVHDLLDDEGDRPR